MLNSARQPAPANDDQAARPLPAPERIQELLFEAARLGRVDVIPALLQAGADLSAIDTSGNTALILASYHGHDAAAHMLLALGADPDQPDTKRGNTALMGAAFKGYGEVAHRLLEAGADPHAVNREGQTALMFAALFGRNALVDRLIARGCDPLTQDLDGNSALSVARTQNNDLMVARLTAGPVHRI
jgi:ankyrin repeat protein